MRVISFCISFILIVSSNAIAQKNITAIMGAFPPELEILRTNMKDTATSNIQGISFLQGKMFGKNIVLVQSGMGKANAAITTTLLLDHFKPDRLLFSGIAGGVDDQLSPGDIVIGTDIGYHDYGIVEPNGIKNWPTKDPVTMQPNPMYFPCDSALVDLADSLATQLKLSSYGNSKRQPSIVKGRIVTGDVFVASDGLSHKLSSELKAKATEMEGAAIAQTCWQQHCPFLIVRSLSDKANNKAHDDVANFYKIAAANSAELVMAIVKAL